MTNYYNINTNDCSKYWDTNIIIEYQMIVIDLYTMVVELLIVKTNIVL